MGVDKRVYTFPICISQEENLAAWLEFELTFYDITIRLF